MATEVGSLNASLTLDISNFQAGMTEVARLASTLGAQLQAIFSGSTGFSQMLTDVRNLIEQIKLLRGAIESFQASMDRLSGADMFSQMRTHTAALPSEIANVASALRAALTDAAALATAFQNIAQSARVAAQNTQGLTPGSAVTPNTLDFSAALEQIKEIRTVLTEVLKMIQSFNTIDLNTGEVMGDGESMPAFYNLYTTIQEINALIEIIIGNLQQCAAAATEWENVMAAIEQHVYNIATGTYQSSNNMNGLRGQTRGVNSAASNINTQFKKVNKTVQTTKGYAISIKGILEGIIVSQTFYRLLNIMGELLNGATDFSKSMQDAGVAFKYLMQDSETSSEAFLNALKDIALRSPLDTTDLAAASRKLMAMGFSAKATVPALQILTDTAAVFSNSAGDMSNMIDHISLAFGQMIASGKVSAQELRQLYNAGLPVYQLLADGLNITMEEAKNIGKQNVDSAQAVYAILKQLEAKYSGAAEDLSMTYAGAMEVIKESMEQLLSYAWENTFNLLTSKVAQLAKFLQAVVKITQTYGPGGLFQAIFPESSWAPLRLVLAGLIQIGKSLKNLYQIVINSFGGGLQILLQIASKVVPILGVLANIITSVVKAAMNASSAIRILFSIIALLAISQVIGKMVLFLGKAIWFLTGAKAAATALMSLLKVMVGFAVANPVVLGVLTAIAAAFLAIVASSEKARAAIARFFGQIGAQFKDFTERLKLGFSTDVAMPKFEMPDTDDFSDGLEDLTGGLEDVGDAVEDTGKKAKKNLQSFDEVFTIDNDASDTADNLNTLKDTLDALNNLNYDNLFDWTGDWATDWGNLLADAGDLGESFGNIFNSLSDVTSNFWQNIADALTANPAVTGSLLGAAIGSVLGGILGGKGGALIGAGLGALAGSVAGMFWQRLAEAMNLDASAASTATISSAIGGVLGGLLGKAMGGTAGGVVGAAIGAFASGFVTLLWNKLHEAFGLSIGAGLAQLGTALVSGISQMLSKLGVGVVTSDAYKFGFSFFSKSGASLTAGIKAGLLNALASLTLSFLTDWLVGKVASSVTDSAERIERAENWSAWGSSILGAIGTVVGTIVAPGLGTIIGGLLGQLIGALGGGALGLWWDDVKSWGTQAISDIQTFFGTTIPDIFNRAKETIGTTFKNAWDGVKTFTTETLPSHWQDLTNKVQTFFGDTIPQKFTDAKETVGGAFSNAWDGVKRFAGETLPTWWQDLGDNVHTFFGETLPQKFTDAGNTISNGLTSAWENVRTFFTETIPQWFYDAGYNLGHSLGTIVAKLTEFFTVTIPQLWNDFITSLNTFFTETLPAAWENFVATLDTFFASIGEKLTIFFTETIPQTWANFVAILDTFFTTIGEKLNIFFTETLPQFGENLLLGLTTFFTETIPMLWEEFLLSLYTFLTNVGTSIETFLTVTLPNFAEKFITDLTVFFTETIPEAWNGFWDNLNQFFSDIIANIFEFFTVTLPAAWVVFVETMKQLGIDIINGLLQGLTSAVTTIWTWLTSFVKGFIQGFKDALGIHSPSTVMAEIGRDIILGLLNGIKEITNTFKSWFTSNVFTPLRNLFAGHLNIANFIQFGQNIMQGIINGVQSLAAHLWSTITRICQNASNAIRNAFRIHSPSKVTTEDGKNIMQGLINGITALAPKFIDTIKTTMQAAKDTLDTSDTEIDPEVDINTPANTAIDSLTTWSITFISIISTTFSTIGNLFDELSQRINAATLTLMNVPTAIDAKMGSLSAVDNLATINTSNTGTPDIKQVLADLTVDTIDKLSAQITARMYEYLAPLFATLSSADQQQVLAYVGTLIADDAGLRELERKLKIIQISEGRRG